MNFEEKNKMNIQDFQKGLLRLSSNFAAIEERDKSKRIKEFEISFNNLISRIKDKKEKGVWRKTYFNLFEILGNQWYEDPHSNLLAWLLNPEETHGLGNVFLEKFIEKISDIKLPFDQIKVVRENQKGGDRPDIEVKGNNWWLIIENKINSSENNSQTLRYAKRWGKKGKIDENVFLVYLSPYGKAPLSSDFHPVSYRKIRELLESMQFHGDSDFLIRNFINHIFIDLEA